jgi:AmmeMemoRadiSam system protein A
MRDDVLGTALLTTARRAIGAKLGRAIGRWPEHAALAAPGATFVTLFHRDALHGCVGTVKAHRPLGIDVRLNAVAAAFRDPRSRALTAGELDRLSVEVSLLAAAEPLCVADEVELLARLVPGVDGVILEHGRRRATFLPQVWATLPEPRDFLAELKLKAGMPVGFWSAEVNVFRYGVTKWKESELLSGEVPA